MERTFSQEVLGKPLAVTQRQTRKGANANEQARFFVSRLSIECRAIEASQQEKCESYICINNSNPH